MKICGINFGPIWAMSGALNFFGEGYNYHKLLKALLGVRVDGLTFVAKTVTLKSRQGNMPMNERTLQPKELLPACIWINHRKGIALNAVGLTNTGIYNMMRRGIWQQRKDPGFFLSFMPVGETSKERLEEAACFVEIVLQFLHEFKSKRFGIQINLTCPNTGHKAETLMAEANGILTAFQPLAERGIVIGVKFSVEIPPETAVEIANHPVCDFVHVSNTVPFRALPDLIDWDAYFGKVPDHYLSELKLGIRKWGEYKGPGGSPLVIERGLKQPGGLSGEPLRLLVVNWVRQVRELGCTKPLNAGGGILHPSHIDELRRADADSYSIGSIFFLRPWAINATIARAHELSQYARGYR